MNARWRRVGSGLGLALAGALLTGCHAQGTFDVLSEDRIAVDLTITGADLNCPNGADALKLTVDTIIDRYGDQVCHVTGETQATYFSPFGITVSTAAEYLVLQANLSGGLDSWPSADIDVRFPGNVVDASRGVVTDNVVKLTDLGELTQGSGLYAVGLRSPGPPAWTLPALIGGGAGIALTLGVGAVVLLVRSGRRHRLAALEELSFPEDAGTLGLRAAPPAVTPIDAAAAPTAGTPRPPPEDTSWFAQPPPGEPTNRQPAANGAGANGWDTNGSGPGDQLQHAAWARPPDEDPAGTRRAG